MDIIQGFTTFIFIIVAAATVVISWWLSKKYQERFAKFPWWKTAVLLLIEFLAWIGFLIFWAWVKSNLWILAVIVVIIIIILLIRRKR